MSTGGDSFCTACNQRLCLLLQGSPGVHLYFLITSFFLSAFVDGMWSECRGLFWVTLQNPSISPVWFWEVCIMPTIFQEPCTSALQTWTICLSRSSLTSPFLAVNHLEWMINCTSFFCAFSNHICFDSPLQVLVTLKQGNPGKLPTSVSTGRSGIRGWRSLTLPRGKMTLEDSLTSANMPSIVAGSVYMPR